MGLSLRFFIGDKATIVNTVESENFEILEELDDAGMCSDFSLHIAPADLDKLFHIISKKQSEIQIGLREYLDTIECFSDHFDRGAFYVDDKIKLLVSNCSKDMVKSTAAEWYELLSLDYPLEDLGDSEDAEEPIADLIRICKIAVKDNKDLVHVWFG